MVEWLSPSQAAARIGVRPSTLATYRRLGCGPRFCMLSDARDCRYRADWIDAWLTAKEVHRRPSVRDADAAYEA
jgi:hypothetical protein